MSEVAICVENLSKRYQIGAKKSSSFRETLANAFRRRTEAEAEATEFWALKDVSFDIKRGEAVGIIGKNGAGKSTLLKVLSRITEPTKGRIEINGRVASLLEVGTGFHPELTGRENIFMNGTILGMNRREIRSKLDEIIDFSGVEKFIDTPVKRYSSGMYVRLAFAVAAHLEPEILIIDEVLAVGDAEFQKKCLGKMGEVAGQGRTVIFVSHDMQAVSTLTKSSVLLRDGKIEIQGNTLEVINEYINSNKTKHLIYVDNRKSNKPKIARVEITTSLPNNIHKNNDSLKVRIIILAPKPIKGACLSFQIVDSKERNYIHSWIFDSELAMCREIDLQELTYNIPQLKLYMGKYFFKLYLSEPPGGELFQVLENVCPFEVVMFGNHRAFQ